MLSAGAQSWPAAGFREYTLVNKIPLMLGLVPKAQHRPRQTKACVRGVNRGSAKALALRNGRRLVSGRQNGQPVRGR